MTYAKIIADSISPEGVRLTTFEVHFHRFTLAEMNTHRTFSRNSASSRAIPFKKQVERIRTDLAFPVVWAAEQKGMQGGDEIEDPKQAETWWATSAEQAIQAAEAIASLGVHKSLVNRLLEPFMWHTAVITSTAWENFFEQRCSPLAQPEIRVAAEMMKAAYDGSEPILMAEGDWHLPYVGDDAEVLDALAGRFDVAPGDLVVKVSAARCARVSYLTQDGKRDYQQDLVLYDRLTTSRPAHWSPLEHVATPWPENRQEGALLFPRTDKYERMIPVAVKTDHLPRVGNLLGWRSLRTEVEALNDEITYR